MMSNDPNRDLKGRRVLVVEDEGLIALDIQSILAGWGCSVVGPAATVSAALKLLAIDPPDCAVLDVNLGNETSEPVAAALRSSGRPFVVMTAYQRSNLSGDLLDAPLLSKPLDERKLWQELSSVLREFDHPLPRG